MIIARVVLPSPGGPDSSTWSAEPPRRRDASSTRPSCSLTRSCPTNSPRVCGRSAAVDGPVLGRLVRVDQARAVVVRLAHGAITTGPGRAGPRAAASARPGRRPPSAGDALDGRVGVASRPAERDKAGVHLPGPVRARCRGAHRMRRRACRRAEPVLELEHQPLRALAPDPGHLGQCHQVLGRDGAPQRVGGVHGQHGLRQPRPDAGHRLQDLEHGPLVVVGEPVQRQGVLAYDEGRGELGRLAEPQRGEGPRGAQQRQADPADLHDGRVRRQGRDPAADVRDHRRPPAASTARACARCAAPGRRGCRALRRPAGRRVAAPEVADRERQRVGAVSRAGHRAHAQQPGHHRPDLGLVGAAVAGDGGLDLARGVQRDGQPATRGRRDGDRAGLGRTHHGAHVVLAEHPLDGDRVGPRDGRASRLDRALEGEQPGGDVVLGRACGRPRRAPAPAAGPAPRRPRRCRTGSGRGRCRARARILQPVAARRRRTNRCSQRYGTAPTGPGTATPHVAGSRGQAPRARSARTAARPRRERGASPRRRAPPSPRRTRRSW